MIPRLTTLPGALQIEAWGEPFATYATHGVPGFGPLFGSGRRAVTQVRGPGGRSVWIGLAGVAGEIFGAPDARDAIAGTFATEDLTVRRGAQSIGFRHVLRWVSADGTPALRETRTVRAAAGPSAGVLLDIECELSPLDDAPLLLGGSDFGPLCLRLAPAMLPDASGQLRNSADDFGPEAISSGIAAWCAGTGVVDGETMGIAVLDHPDNPLHPCPWTATTDGLLSPAPLRGRTLTVEAGRTLRFSYRIIVHAGYVEAGWVDARLQDWIHGRA
ncbi:MAG TPA: DUF6807 family protein [Chthonomonadaceae bacterium]|nr:DUF6807 family protein [Chthonomonadaceae bacterium]